MASLLVALVVTWGFLLSSCSGIEGEYPELNTQGSKGRSDRLTPPGVEGRGTFYPHQRNREQSDVVRAAAVGAEEGSYTATNSESREPLFDSEDKNSFYSLSDRQGSIGGSQGPLEQIESRSSVPYITYGTLRSTEEHQKGHDAPSPLSSNDPDEAEGVLDLARLANAIPGAGVPGEDYPILFTVPDTLFSCEDQEYPGYYADTAPEAECQVFHICHSGGQKDSFLCPMGTLFRQEVFVCDWWFNVDCTDSQRFFRLNENLGRLPDEAYDILERTETSNGLNVTMETEIPLATFTRDNGRSDPNYGYRTNGFF